MRKRKMIQSNLLRNSISAYFAAIEIHNKPNIQYRYETVTLLMLNAWELLLKAFIRKYVKGRSVFESDKKHTICFEKAIAYTSEYINKQKPKSFVAIQKNLEEIEMYRNGIVHFYCEELEPYIFMLIARAALNFVDFIKVYFDKDIMQDDGLFIMPLGFKLPFRPEEFLSNNSAKYVAGEETKEFINSIVNTIKELDNDGIDESIVLGFDIYLESVKKAKNSDILAAITTVENADVTFAKVTNVKFSKDPNAQIYNMSDDEFRRIWKYTYQDVVDWCRENIKGFKQNAEFNKYKKEIEKDINCAYMRKLDNMSPSSPSKTFYTDLSLEKIKSSYEKNC
nr:DUF3644 domain-containing protein [uncultured Granulicatella sp.]